MPELLDQRAQNGKSRRLLAKLLFREELRQRLQAAAQRGSVCAEGFPMRVALEHRLQHSIEHFTALIERAKLDLAVDGDDLERRTRGGEIPARISPGKFVSGRQVYAAVGIQIFQKA